MTALRRQRFALPTGVELDVTLGGNGGGGADGDTGDPILFLHGFPESARTWRHQLADLATDHVVVAPDQRGFARSSKPRHVEDYATDLIVADAIALADALGLARFTLVGHDWGGAAAWAVALKHPDRVARLIIANAPHPLIFQKSLIDDPAQRAASQYMRAFRDPAIEARTAEWGIEGFYARSFEAHVPAGLVDADERAIYLDQWRQPGALTAMLNWYRASKIIVPAMGEEVERPAWIDQPFPKLAMPTLVIWGMQDKALLPCQLDGLDALVPDLRIVAVEDAGHFVPWERPDAVTAAIRAFLAERARAD
ncbi:Pimeloyl-ACP methyl ester carboxylesterase [Sphingomonas laterariae]|uniref:Pimeloyl-ACP methyl ester carboxylesterase n=1 Tax=Edaphosphingomonas laterariae TaxID=861865 RepID=A0A239G7C6_9SPHN|nr:alpha/beta hydrolase [Sphingomonas laterariae]SNS65246.1 Pimeloyl-ACP methyl ester carboxylesterase [Sphingomonas laterariae]